MTKHIGILTAGGDSPGLNAAIRGVGKAAQNHYDMQMIGFLDGFRGLVDNRSIRLEGDMLSDILTRGGTILGTSNKADPRRFKVSVDRDGNDVFTARSLSTGCPVATCHRSSWSVSAEVPPCGQLGAPGNGTTSARLRVARPAPRRTRW